MFQLHMGVQKCVKSCLKMSKNDEFGVFRERGRGKWVGAVFQYCNIAVLQTNIAILVLSIALLLQYFFKSSIGVLQYCKKLKSCNTAILLENINFAKAINAKV